MGRVRHLPQGYLDADLFLVKHLLVLREQLTPFEAEFAARERSLDFSATTGALSHFLNSGRAMFALSRANAFLGLMREGLPRVYERTVDSKKVRGVGGAHATACVCNPRATPVPRAQPQAGLRSVHPTRHRRPGGPAPLSARRPLRSWGSRGCRVTRSVPSPAVRPPALYLQSTDWHRPRCCRARGRAGADRRPAAGDRVLDGRVSGQRLHAGRAVPAHSGAHRPLPRAPVGSLPLTVLCATQSNVHEALGRLRRALDSTASEEAVAAVEAAAAKVGAAVDGTRVELLHCPDAPE